MHPLLLKYPIISDQVEKPELHTILTELELVLANKIEGDIVELGCYVGTTSLFISRLLKQTGINKKFYVYDSFEGLPEKSQLDESPAGTQFMKGELLATKKQFIANYQKSNLSLPIIKKSWFNELTPDDIPNKIAFAFLDGDYYESINTSLRLIWPKLTKGGKVLIDDYQSESLPGAKRAVDEWVASHPCNMKITHSLAVLSIS